MPCPVEPWKPPVTGTLSHPWRARSRDWLIVLTVKKFLSYMKTKPLPVQLVLITCLLSSSWLAFGPSPCCPCHCMDCGDRTGHNNQAWPEELWVEGCDPSLSLLVMQLWVQPRVWFVLVAVAGHCWLLLSLLSARTPRSLPARLFPGHTDPSLYSDLWLCCPCTCLCWVSDNSCLPQVSL